MDEPRTWMCLICGWIYNEAEGDPEHDIPKGTAWADAKIASTMRHESAATVACAQHFASAIYAILGKIVKTVFENKIGSRC